MRYLILIFLFTIGCTEKPESRLWTIKNDCTKLGNLVGAKTVRMFDKEENDRLNAVCEITKPRDFIYWLRNEEVEGAVRGIIMYQNRLKVEKLDDCLQESKCKNYKFDKSVECMFKCKKKLGWAQWKRLVWYLLM